MKHRALKAILTLLISAVFMQPTALAFANSSSAMTAPSFVWQRTYVSEEPFSTSSMVQTSDGGYALAGCAIVISLGEIEYVVTKIDFRGHEQWSINGFHFNFSEPDYGPASSIVQTPDGGYAFVGHSSKHSYLIKTDPEGNIEYRQRYAGFQLSVLRVSDDGGFVMVGGQNTRLLLAKANSTGDVEWIYTYEETVGSVLCSMIQTSDGGYALAGDVGNVILVKTDSLGDVLWSQNYYGFSNRFPFPSLIETSGGGYVLAGSTSNQNTTSVCIIRIDEQGKMLWNQTYPELGTKARSVVETIDGGYAFATSSDGASKGNLVKVDSKGSLQWVLPCDGIADVLQTSDGAYSVVSVSVSKGIWHGKTTADPVKPSPSPTPTATPSSLSPTPTPISTITSTLPPSPSPTITEQSTQGTPLETPSNAAAYPATDYTPTLTVIGILVSVAVLGVVAFLYFRKK